LDEEKGLRKLKIDYAELETALENNSGEFSSYLDTETGEVIHVTEDTRQELERIYDEELEEDSAGEGDEESDDAGEFDLDSYLEHSDLPDWQKEEIKAADRVEQGVDDRYIEIPAIDSPEAFSFMEDFVETVTNRRLRDRLGDALSMDKPFRRFKDLIAGFPAEEERWFKYEADRKLAYITQWLQDEDIDPVFEKEQ
jgi:hypothetical protein